MFLWQCIEQLVQIVDAIKGASLFQRECFHRQLCRKDTVRHHGRCQIWVFPRIGFLMIPFLFLWSIRNTTSFFQFAENDIKRFAVQKHTAGVIRFLI